MTYPFCSDEDVLLLLLLLLLQLFRLAAAENDLQLFQLAAETIVCSDTVVTIQLRIFYHTPSSCCAPIEHTST